MGICARTQWPAHPELARRASGKAAGWVWAQSAVVERWCFCRAGGVGMLRAVNSAAIYCASGVVAIFLKSGELIMAIHITAGGDELQRAAMNIAEQHLLDALEAIDKKLGSGYAREHPELIGVYMQTATTHLGIFMIGRALEEIAQALKK